MQPKTDRCACGGSCPRCREQWSLQKKLAISEPGDAYEQEAVRVADKVMRMPAHPAVNGVPPRIQRFAGPPTGQWIPPPPASTMPLPVPKERWSQCSGRTWSSASATTFRASGIHADAAAAATLGARAFTAGSHIVLGLAETHLASAAGRYLVAHELAHVVQHERGAAAPVPGDRQRRVDDPRLEREADAAAASATRGEPAIIGGVAPAGAVLAQDDGAAEPTLSASAEALIPAYLQEGDTCGAVSLVTALMIWDREHRRPDGPSQATATACDLVLAELYERRADDEQAYGELVSWIEDARATALTPGAEISEEQYNRIGASIYSMWLDPTRRLTPQKIDAIERSLGLRTSTSAGVSKYDDLWNNSVLHGLLPDQIAQIEWWVRTSGDIRGDYAMGEHAFLIGCLGSGEWFLSDQAAGPARFSAPTREELRRIVDEAAWANQYWIVPRDPAIISSNRVRLLASPDVAAAQGAEAIVLPGKFLGQVDENWLSPFGEDNVRSGPFTASGNSRNAVETQLTGPGSGLLIEAAPGTFFLYRATEVSDENLMAKTLDIRHSTGGLLLERKFVHAWLILGNAAGKRGNTIAAY